MWRGLVHKVFSQTLRSAQSGETSRQHQCDVRVKLHFTWLDTCRHWSSIDIVCVCVFLLFLVFALYFCVHMYIKSFPEHFQDVGKWSDVDLTFFRNSRFLSLYHLLSNCQPTPEWYELVLSEMHFLNLNKWWLLG